MCNVLCEVHYVGVPILVTALLVLASIKGERPPENSSNCCLNLIDHQKSWVFAKKSRSKFPLFRELLRFKFSTLYPCDVTRVKFRLGLPLKYWKLPKRSNVWNNWDGSIKFDISNTRNPKIVFIVFIVFMIDGVLMVYPIPAKIRRLFSGGRSLLILFENVHILRHQDVTHPLSPFWVAKSRIFITNLRFDLPPQDVNVSLH